MNKNHAGFSLVELIVAVGLFAMVMTIATGAYLIMINANRHAQGLSTGVNNLSYVLESMTRNIRTGTNYNCANPSQGVFEYKTTNPAHTVSYSFANGVLYQTVDGATAVPLTDSAVQVSSFSIVCTGTGTGGNTSANSDAGQAHVDIYVSGTIASGPGRTQTFHLETGATMRQLDI